LQVRVDARIDKANTGQYGHDHVNLGGDGRKIAVSGRREYKRRRWEFIFTLAIASSRT